ncbi:hypothetical protein IFM89_009568 [Coptis chinensis]|uniref:Uncharacterized protein n=1 Tax=Coptis chinensis TaxID=261450 RepID=A0A835IP90_9MAGN|nr:hypothetical protein IFM89_009568 [Coptis chinensis]
MAKVFRGHGLDYDVDGLTGNTLDNHRLITFAGHQGYDKQNALVEELHLGYFTQGKYIGDKCSFCDHSPTMPDILLGGYPRRFFRRINGKNKLDGGQPPEVFARAFQAAD